jgi:dTDP-4-dehydrorhamnose reductase
MKILVTGSNGLLGQKLVAALQHEPEVELIATSRGEDRTPAYLLPFSADGSKVMRSKGHRYHALDITDEAAVQEVFDQVRPDVVIHTAAMTNVDACELDPEACHLQNVKATEHLVRAAKKHESHFIHLSTDFIFNGKAGPYKEEDEPDPLSIYGHSKLYSERIVMDAGLERWAIARTIIVYGIAPGLSRSNVVLWAKNALEKGEPIKVVDDQYRMPTLAEDLADGCIRIAKRGATGIYHLSGPDGMSILELVQRVGRFFDLDTSVVSPVKSDTLGQPAKRPPRTGFILDKARKELGYAPRSFEEGLEVLRIQLNSLLPAQGK